MLGRIAAPRQAWGVTFCELLVGLWREKCRGRHSADGGGHCVNLWCGSGARGAAVASGRTPARGGETARAAATRAPSAPGGPQQSVAVFFLCLSGRRGDRGIHRTPAKFGFGAQCVRVKAFATATCSLEPCQENAALFGRNAAPRKAGGTCCKLLVGLWRENSRGRHAAEGGDILLTSGARSRKGAATKCGCFFLGSSGR